MNDDLIERAFYIAFYILDGWVDGYEADTMELRLKTVSAAIDIVAMDIPAWHRVMMDKAPITSKLLEKWETTKHLADVYKRRR